MKEARSPLEIGQVVIRPINGEPSTVVWINKTSVVLVESKRVNFDLPTVHDRKKVERWVRVT